MSKNNPGFGMTADRYAAFINKNADGNLIYKMFEKKLVDALTLEYSYPDLVESKNNKTKLQLLNIKKNAKKQLLERNSKHRKDISNKEDKYESDLEVLNASIDEIKSLLSKETKKSNGIQTDKVKNTSNLLLESEKKLELTKSIHSREMLVLESIFESDIDIIKDIERDDTRNCIQLKNRYVNNLLETLTSEIATINNKYPTEELKMEPKIEVEVQNGEPIVILPLNIIEFIKNKLIDIKPKPVLNRKFGLTEDDDDDSEMKEIIRLENLATILEAQNLAKKERERKKY